MRFPNFLNPCWVLEKISDTQWLEAWQEFLLQFVFVLSYAVLCVFVIGMIVWMAFEIFNNWEVTGVYAKAIALLGVVRFVMGILRRKWAYEREHRDIRREKLNAIH